MSLQDPQDYSRRNANQCHRIEGSQHPLHHHNHHPAPAVMDRPCHPNVHLPPPEAIAVCIAAKGRYTQGEQKERYKENIKTHLRKCYFSLNTCEEAVFQRGMWSWMVHEGSTQLQRGIHCAVDIKRKLRKDRPTNKTAPYQPQPQSP